MQIVSQLFIISEHFILVRLDLEPIPGPLAPSQESTLDE